VHALRGAGEVQLFSDRDERSQVAQIRGDD
jgi:hypothetical protein